MAPKIKQRDDFMGQDQRALIFEDLSHLSLQFLGALGDS